MPHLINPFVNKIICGQAAQILERLPDESVDCVMTSPPYWALRDYGVKGQLGLEARFQDYIDKLCALFDEVKRILKKDGTCWVNLGDTYATSSRKDRTLKNRQPLLSKAAIRALPSRQPTTDLHGKCLVQIPSRFALEMTNRGWILRNEIIWHKPNCMPTSAKDRFTVDFEKLLFFVKSRYYYFAQQFEELRDKERLRRNLINPQSVRKRVYGDPRIAAINPSTAEASRLRILAKGRNKRCVWTIPTMPFRDKHFAVYPPALIETPIRAGCPKGGIVLDPFIGSGTTALVAKKLGRRFIGIDLNPHYVRMANRRLAQQDV